MRDVLGSAGWLWLAVFTIALSAIATFVLRSLLQYRQLTRANRRDPIGLRHAIVLLHGIFGFDRIGRGGIQQEYFRGVARYLARLKVDVFCPRLSAADRIEIRAAQLERFVRELDQPVVIVAHSMGGLDARYALSRLALDRLVCCLVTIGTPHRGTPLASLGRLPPLRLLRWLGNKFRFSTKGIDMLTAEAMQRFNLEVPDSPRVAYFSVVATAGWRTILFAPLLWLSHRYLRRAVGANDGMVPRASQAWGQVLLEIEADHWSQIGWSWRFNARRFYERLLRELQRRGY